MIDISGIGNILFMDIETVPQYANYSDLPGDARKFWDKKAQYIKNNEENPSELYSRAGIYAEFGKIICISVGNINFQNNQTNIRIKSFYGDDESLLLNDFCDIINKYGKGKIINLCAHNGKEFDFPYIARRILINRLKLPDILNIAGKKPWEVPFIDTLELWKFGDYKHYTSLDLMAYLFNIPTPKDDIDGSMVGKIYYEEKDIKRIVTYCEKDVLAVAQLYLSYLGEDLIQAENVFSINTNT